MSDNSVYRDYDRFYSRRNAGGSDRYSRSARNYARQFGPLLTGDRQRKVLDIGCADGMLVAFLKELGFAEVTGIDINAELIARARTQVDAEFIASDAATFLAQGRTFDLIFLLNVVEHIPRHQLVDFMTRVNAALRPGGFAVVRCPNMSHLMAPGHLADDLTHCTGLTEQSLQQLARSAGFTRVELLNQWRMQNPKGKLKALLSGLLHRYLWWLRGGTRPTVVYRNLYARLLK